MKKIAFALCVVLLLQTVGCSKAFMPPEASDSGDVYEHVPPESPPDAVIGEEQTPADLLPAPVKLSASDLSDILDAIDLTEASLTYHREAETTYPADAAIRAESYLDEFKSLELSAYTLPDEWDGNVDDFMRLTTPDVTIISPQRGYGDNRLLYLMTENSEGWFILPYEQDEPNRMYWQIYSNFFSWYEEAKAASLFGGTGTPLTAAELDYFEEYTTSIWTEYDAEWGGYIGGSTEISCFFTSHYSDPRDMDANAFLAYCPVRSTLIIGGEEDEEEWQLVQKVINFRSGEDNPVISLDDLPVPCHRHRRTEINELLTTYAGITVEEMHTDWTSEAQYVPETDSFYTFTSDFGPGRFIPCYGEKNGDIVTLWAAPDNYDDTANMLTLQKSGENWRILSHEAVNW
jgi:hypothetical protein